MENKYIILTTILILFTPSILVMYKTYRDEKEINDDVFGAGVVCFVCTFTLSFLVSIAFHVVFILISCFLES